jgi:hypothetical protein
MEGPYVYSRVRHGEVGNNNPLGHVDVLACQTMEDVILINGTFHTTNSTTDRWRCLCWPSLCQDW